MLKDERARSVIGYKPGPRPSILLMLNAGALRTQSTARIAATKRRCLEGGLLQLVSWGVPIGEPDIRGRITYAYSEIDALIEQRPALDRSTLSTDRADNTVLTILEPLAITDEHLFQWGDPVHVHKIKAVDGIVQDEASGVRFFQRSEHYPLTPVDHIVAGTQIRIPPAHAGIARHHARRR